MRKLLLLLGQTDVPDRYDIHYLGAFTILLAVIKHAFHLALVAYNTDGKDLLLIFSAENTYVLRLLIYYEPVLRFC